MTDFTMTEKQAWDIMDALVTCDEVRLRNALMAMSGCMYSHYTSEPAPARLKSDENNLRQIWDALGMSMAGKPTLDKILNVIEHNHSVSNSRNENLSERFELLETLRSQLSVQQWDQMSGALSNLKQRVVEAEKSHEILDGVEERLRNSAFLYPRDNTSSENNSRYRLASELLMYIKGDRAVCAPAQKAADEASDPLHMAEAKISELEAKLVIAERTAERGADDNVKLTKLRAIIDGVHSYDSQMAWLEALRKAAE